ncbi:MAG: 23S rRNA (adenine(2503)-C(2))-methyltransferase RlmN [bacterium]|nr:23S rRNA (adenine(2503)-C(2))-methyltransferase RlmN [bacterium]
MELTRQQQYKKMFPDQPVWRWEQIERAFFNPQITNWLDITTISADLRASLTQNLPWLTVTPDKLFTSRDQQTYKALLALIDGEKIETVLMKNKRGQWSVCVSSQVGCAMNCSFCATGRMGLRRNLTSDEIADQLRYWFYFLRDKKITERVSNIVMMGMGEPLANYDNVVTALWQWLHHTDIGANHITVSTVGLMPFLKKILEDKDWPPVRLAISLHSANETLRKKIVPSTGANFLAELAAWVKEYLKIKGSNKRHITFEYILLRGVNDSARDAKTLADFVMKTGRIKVNLIPFNDINDARLERSPGADEFAKILTSCGVTTTVRQSAGADIMAACGQLAGDDRN